jgi:hypothetical protein
MFVPRLAQFAIAAAALVIGSQAKSATPLSYGNYYDEYAVALCGSTLSCKVSFGQTPSDKLVLVRKIHCRFNSAQPLSFITFNIGAISGNNALPRRLPLQFFPVHAGAAAQSDGYFRYTVDMTTQFLVGQGRFPYVESTGTAVAVTSGECTLIGDLVAPI